MKLYKYVDENIVRVFEESRLKLTPLHELNDPFESLPSIDLTYNTRQLKQRFLDKDALRGLWERNPERCGQWGTFKKFVAAMRNPETKKKMISVMTDVVSLRRGIGDVVEGQRRSGFLLSLTEVPSDILMWAHYARSHTGGVVELVCQSNPVSLQHVQLHKVRYDLRRPSIKPILIGQALNEQYTAAYLTKSPHWSYEKEWRTIFPKDLLKHDRGRYYLSIEPECITGVIFGCNMKWDLKEQLRGMLGKEPWKHVKIREAQLHNEEYKLNIN